MMNEHERLPSFEQIFYLVRSNPKLLGLRLKSSEGEIEFYGGKELGNDEIAIYCINIIPELQRKGIFTNLLKTIMHHEEYRRVSVLGMGSDSIENCLKKFEYDGIRFIDHGGDGIWTRDIE